MALCDRLFDDRFLAPLQCAESFDVDIPAVTQDIVFTINGQPPPANAFETGIITLRNLETGDRVHVGESHENGGQYSIRVIAGQYQAFWGLENGGSIVPSNQSAVLGTFVVDGSVPLDIDMGMVTVAGSFTLDGGPPPESEFESARIALRNFQTGDEMFLGLTSDGSFQRQVVPGEYHIVYELSQGGLVVPKNAEAIVDTVTVPNAPEIVVSVDVELESGAIWGDVRFNGELPPDSSEDHGRIFFQNPDFGQAIPVGDTRNGTYGARLLTGSYDVYYRAVSPGGVAPVNTNARIMGGQMVSSGNQTLDVDIDVVDLEATITLNGETPPISVFEDGKITLRVDDTGDEALIGRTSDNEGMLSARVIPGAYAAFWDLNNGGSVVPANRRARLESVQVQQGVPLTIDVPMVQAAGDFFLNGEQAPGSAFESARIELGNRETDDEVFLGDTHNGSYLRRLIPGTYDVVYRLEAGGSSVPRNGHALFAEHCIPDIGMASEVRRDVHMRAVWIAGGFYFNGDLAPASEFETGQIFLVDRITGDEVPVGDTKDGSFNIRVMPGEYEVFYSRESGGGLVPRNKRARVGSLDVCL